MRIPAALLFLSGSIVLTQVQIPDARVVDTAKKANVHDLDSSIASQPLVDWLTALVGKDTKITWGSTDCGEGSGSPADAGRILPVCGEVIAHLPIGRVVLEVLVGNRQFGVKGHPALYSVAILNQAGSDVKFFKTLSELAAALRKK